jgi:hypothetical protein
MSLHDRARLNEMLEERVAALVGEAPVPASVN